MADVAETKPFARYEWMLASRYLRSRRKEGFISVIAGFSFVGIMLGVATLIIVMSVMNGIRSDLFEKILGLTGHVIINAVGRDFTDYDAAARRIEKVPGVTQALPIIEGQALLSTPAASRGVSVRGLREQDLMSLTAVSSKIRYGSIKNFEGANSIALGIGLANALGAWVGDEITLVSPRGASTPFGTAPRMRRYKVRAVFELGMQKADEIIAFLPLAEAQKFFNMKDAVHALEVLTEDPHRIDELTPKIAEAAGSDTVLRDWRKLNADFYNAVQVERVGMFIILTLIILVAALNIISGLIMLVTNKGRDIGILRTMGASSGAIMRVFMITGIGIGVAGTLAGFVLGIVIAANIQEILDGFGYLTGVEVFSPRAYGVTELRAEFATGEIAAVVGMALGLSFLATLYPSRRAARLDPVEALRYE